jgi:hypothetical protein
MAGAKDMARARIPLLIAALITLPCAARAQAFDYSAWDRTLATHVTGAGLVDYAVLRANPEELKRFISEVAARSPVSDPKDFSTRADQMAYWINAYNALVISGVLESWPVRSVLDIGVLPHSFFWKRRFTVGGREMTLDDIEKDMLRKQFGDPRIHFALVCASKSCPRLGRQAYRPETLDQQLDAAARSFINDPRGMKIDAAQNRVSLSHIFKWYGEDFEAYVRSKNLQGSGPPVLTFVRQYLDDAKRRDLDALHSPSIQYMDYDWGINATAVPSK